MKTARGCCCSEQFYSKIECLFGGLAGEIVELVRPGGTEFVESVEKKNTIGAKLLVCRRRYTNTYYKILA